MNTVKSPILAGAITKGLNGSMQVELRQTLTRQYDDSNSIHDSLFDGVRSSFDEIRVAWRGIGDSDTKETVEAQLKKFPNACLYRILSDEVILHDGQERVYNNGFSGPTGTQAFEDFKKLHGIKSTEWDAACAAKFLEVVTKAQLVRYGEGNSEAKPADEAVLYNGKKQYRIIAFSKTERADIDLRNEKAVTKDITLAPKTVEATVEA